MTNYHTQSLYNCLSENKIKKLELLLNKDNVNTIYESEFWTMPLMLAVNISNLEVVKYLHKLGANLNYKNKLGQSILDWAAASGTSDNLEKCKYIIENTQAVDLNWQNVSPKMYDELKAFVEMMILKEKLEKNILVNAIQKVKKI